MAIGFNTYSDDLGDDDWYDKLFLSKNYNDNDWDFNRGPDHLSKEAVFQIFKNLNKEDREWLINKVNLREYE